MEENKKKPVYEKPSACHLNDYKSGKGDCNGPGSGDGSCAPGNAASGSCFGDGNLDGGYCSINGNSAATCLSIGNGG